MDFLTQIREQAAQYSALNSPEKKQAFVQEQLAQLASLSPDQQLAHLQAIKTMSQELNQLIDEKQRNLVHLAA